MEDIQYKDFSNNLVELEHCYGSNVHIISTPTTLRLLSLLASPNSQMPLINHYVEELYRFLLHMTLNLLGKRAVGEVQTRMKVSLKGEFLIADQRCIVVDLARAGTLPAQLCFNILNLLFNPINIRQDHIYLQRKVDNSGKVIGVDYSGSKIGGEQQDALVLFPDPMGATGGSMARVISQYKKEVKGEAFKYVAMHLIVTPEYLKYMQQQHPDVEIFAVRLDRGLSSDDILHTVPGTHWDQERGLNDNQYIIPGAGGVGELLNNTEN